MIRIIHFLFLLFSVVSYSQKHPAIINKAAGLPDGLTYNNEIRIYIDYQITDSADLFRLYETENDKWVAELYRFSIYKPLAEKEVLKDTDYEQLWVDIENNKILYIPTGEDIRYKLIGDMSIVYEDGKKQYRVTSRMITDGLGYEIFIKKGLEQNHIQYSNPEGYLRIYPEVDELNYIVNVINSIRNKFCIWQE